MHAKSAAIWANLKMLWNKYLSNAKAYTYCFVEGRQVTKMGIVERVGKVGKLEKVEKVEKIAKVDKVAREW